jgi:uncharacterized membrane protein
VLVGLVIRVVLMRSIWVDEAISIHQAHMSLGGMIDNLRATDRHPPLHYLILWLTVRLFGDGELATRGPSIIASAALIPAMFATGRELFDRRTGLVARRASQRSRRLSSGTGRRRGCTRSSCSSGRSRSGHR